MKLFKDGKNLAAFELSIAIILFILRTMGFQVASLSQNLLLTDLSFAMILILMVATYALISINYKKGKVIYVHSLLLAAFLVTFILSYFVQPQLFFESIFDTLVVAFNVYIYVPILIFMLVLGTIGTYLIRIKRRPVAGLVLFIIVFALLAVILTYALQPSYPSDESVLSFYGLQFLEHGGNPYSTSIAGVLYNLSKSGDTDISLYTTNQLPGVMLYPSLYFLSSIPFYLLSQPTIYNLEHTDMPVQAALLITLLIFVILMKIKKEEILKPKLILLVLLVLLVASSPSVTTFLMAALLLVAYFGIGSKYAWLLIGLAVSLQEELWFPCLLLIIYSFNNYGTKKGLRTLVGAALVFIAFNIYFILLNPSAYLSAFQNSLIYGLPGIKAPIGYFILSNYHVLIGSLSTFFVLIILLLTIIFAVLNRKEFVLLFTMIIYFFSFHALNAYYVLPGMLFVVMLYSPHIKEGSGRLLKYLVSNTVARCAFCLIILVIALSSVAILYASHLVYTNNFNVSVTNQSISTIGNTTTYTADLVYRNPGINYTYFGLYVLSKYGAYQYGFTNQQILSNNESSCNSYNCTISMNRILTNDSESLYRIHAVFILGGDQTPGAVAAVLYNRNYFYAATAVYNSS